MSHHHHFHHRRHRHVKINRIPPPPPPPPPAPIAAFVGSPVTGQIPVPVQFTDQSLNTPTSWAWDFGDGGTSTAQNPSHTYTVAGTYSVALTASNAYGSNTLTKTDYIVAAPDPVPEIVRGVFAFFPTGTSVPSNVLSNPKIKGVSIIAPWSEVKPTQNTSDYSRTDALMAQIAAAGKKIFIRYGGQGGNPLTGEGFIPPWVYTLLGLDPLSHNIVPGVSYVFNDATSASGVRCIPVFYNPTYVALRLAFIAEWTAHLATLSSTIRNAVAIVGMQLCESQHGDWYMPCRNIRDTTGGPNGTGYDRTEIRRWTDTVVAGGAGYTSAKMLDQMQQLMTATITGIDGAGLAAGTKVFGAFTFSGTNLQTVDLAAAQGEGYPYPQIYMIYKFTDWANTTYPSRFLLARESLAACNQQDANLTQVGGAPWYWAQNLTAPGGRNAAQMLWNSNNDTTYRNNGGSNINCKHGIDPRYPNLTSTYQDINDQSADHAGHTPIGFGCDIAEFYISDCQGLDMTWAKSVLDP